MKYSDNRIRSGGMSRKSLGEFNSVLVQENEYAESTGGIGLKKDEITEKEKTKGEEQSNCRYKKNHPPPPRPACLYRKNTVISQNKRAFFIKCIAVTLVTTLRGPR